MAGPYEYDELGVRVRETDYGKIDAGIAEHIEDINDLGYKSVQSMSGLWEDYEHAPDRYSADGYIAFFKDELTDQQVAEIEEAAERAGLYVKHRPVFFAPAISVRVGVTQQGTSFHDLWLLARQEANRIAVEEWGFDLKPSKPSVVFPGERTTPAPDFGDDREAWSRWNRLQDEIKRELIEEQGAPTDEIIKQRWDRFVEELHDIHGGGEEE